MRNSFSFMVVFVPSTNNSPVTHWVNALSMYRAAFTSFDELATAGARTESARGCQSGCDANNCILFLTHCMPPISRLGKTRTTHA